MLCNLEAVGLENSEDYEIVSFAAVVEGCCVTQGC